MYGHNGKILKVDLSTGDIKHEKYDEEFARMFLGGNGLAAKMIYDIVPSSADPLGPENAVVFSVGPLTDTPLWGTSRGHVATVSPLTGFFADSNYGGQFGTAQKRTGFDAICITGKSPKPAYLVVSEDGAEIKDGDPYWGKTTEEAIATLEAKEGEGAICASIGPAGEQGVFFANVICGGRRPGAAGRGGVGTVMGSKYLKALVVKGNKRTGIADRGSLSKLLKEKYPAFEGNTKALKTYGTPVLVNSINAMGMLGTRNNSKEEFDYAQDISGELIKEKYWNNDIACHGCPVACGKNVTVAKGEFKDKIVKMPEYETLYAMGAMMDNRSIDSIISGNHLCDLMGIDTISMGVTLAFVAECTERGIVTESELGGEVNFAQGEAMVDLIKQTARREGIGKHLALGSARLSEKFGREVDKYLYAVKKLEIAGHSARGLRGMSLSYAVGTRGGSHHDGRPNYLTVDPDPGFDPQPEYILKNNHFTAVGDSLVLCRFIGERGIGTPLNEDTANIVNFVTGWSIALSDLEKIGERVYNQERLISVERGASRKDDTLPYRVMNEPIPGGPAKGRCCPQEELDKMLDGYYALRGWSPDGIPTDAKLQELGLK
ncbi:MAG: aldehyde ferredoxin oxidoreductase family protein [Desulfobacteraceae bacterium]|jgi:aldehyde:ferredoxin oxidoreductase